MMRQWKKGPYGRHFAVTVRPVRRGRCTIFGSLNRGKTKSVDVCMFWLPTHGDKQGTAFEGACALFGSP
jgi:hypothetical protein